MLGKIDAINEGAIPWRSFNVETSLPNEQVTYTAYYRDPVALIQQMLDNPELDGHFDYVPHVDLDEQGTRVWKDFMSGNWAYKQAVSLK